MQKSSKKTVSKELFIKIFQELLKTRALKTKDNHNFSDNGTGVYLEDKTKLRKRAHRQKFGSCHRTQQKLQRVDKGLPHKPQDFQS